ncbi:MAG: hypothetical protein ACTSPN_10495 [Promethearchaeota archaeon]
MHFLEGVFFEKGENGIFLTFEGLKYVEIVVMSFIERKAQYLLDLEEFTRISIFSLEELQIVLSRICLLSERTCFNAESLFSSELRNIYERDIKHLMLVLAHGTKRQEESKEFENLGISSRTFF